MSNIRERDEMRFCEVIEFLHLRAGVTHALLQAEIGTIDELCERTRAELRALRLIGVHGVEDIRGALHMRANRYLADDPSPAAQRSRARETAAHVKPPFASHPETNDDCL